MNGLSLHGCNYGKNFFFLLIQFSSDFLMHQKTTNCLYRNVKSYGNIHSFPEISEKNSLLTH